ncbi:unnamed protein product [Rhizophagus irregularis]|nr:unnamed protein product [Rhizophagus irregularis]
MGRHKDRSINVNNKKPYKKYTLPDQEEIDRLINKSTVLNTKRATTAWLNKFENFRSNIGKCTEVADIHELEEYTDENDYTYLNKWYKTNNIGEKRMRTFLHELAKECGIDVMGRKITNHSVRKTLVELLKDLGFSDIEVMSVS